MDGYVFQYFSTSGYIVSDRNKLQDTLSQNEIVKFVDLYNKIRESKIKRDLEEIETPSQDGPKFYYFRIDDIVTPNITELDENLLGKKVEFHEEKKPSLAIEGLARNIHFTNKIKTAEKKGPIHKTAEKKGPIDKTAEKKGPLKSEDTNHWIYKLNRKVKKRFIFEFNDDLTKFSEIREIREKWGEKAANAADKAKNRAIKKEKQKERILENPENAYDTTYLTYFMKKESEQEKLNTKLKEGKTVIICCFNHSYFQNTSLNKDTFLENYFEDEVRIQYIDAKNSRYFTQYNMRIIRFAWIISPAKHQAETDVELHDFKISASLKYAVRIDLELRINENTWTVIGDETGGLEEFKGGSPWSPSAMCWVVIPPKSEIEHLPMNFHATDNHRQRREGLKQLAMNEDVLYFYLPFSSANFHHEKYDSLGQDPHLQFWRQSLHLVLESFCHRVKDGEEIDIYVENVKDLESQRWNFTGDITDIVDSRISSGRKSWKNIQFGESWILSKGEHPFIGYPDVIYHIFKDHAYSQDKKYSLEQNEENNNQFHNYITYLRHSDRYYNFPFEMDSLKKVNRTLMIHKPVEFLISVIKDFNIEEYERFLRPFFKIAIEDTFEQMTELNWQEFCEFIRIEGNLDRTRQTIVKFCLGCIPSFEKLANEVLKNPLIRFEFFMTILGNSNHDADTDISKKCIIEIQTYLGYNIDKRPRGISLNRYYDFLNHKYGHSFNIFDFSVLDKEKEKLIQEHIFGIKSEKNNATYLQKFLNLFKPISVIKTDIYESHSLFKLLGTLGLGLALRNSNNGEDIQLAKKIEQKLFNIELDRFNEKNAAHLLRRRIYHAELLMTGPNANAKLALRELLEDISDSKFSTIAPVENRPYFFATLLKCLFLNNKECKEINVEEILSTLISEKCEFENPWSRICYWGAKYLSQMGLKDSNNYRLCIEKLREMKLEPKQKMNVRGVMLSSYLLELEKDLTEESLNAISFRNMVYEISNEKTKKWLDSKLENNLSYPLDSYPKNPLSPLNFYYC